MGSKEFHTALQMVGAKFYSIWEIAVYSKSSYCEGSYCFYIVSLYLYCFQKYWCSFIFSHHQWRLMKTPFPNAVTVPCSWLWKSFLVFCCGVFQLPLRPFLHSLFPFWFTFYLFVNFYNSCYFECNFFSNVILFRHLKKTEYLCSVWFFFIQSIFTDRYNSFQQNFLYSIEDINFLSSNLKRYFISDHFL